MTDNQSLIQELFMLLGMKEYENHLLQKKLEMEQGRMTQIFQSARNSTSQWTEEPLEGIFPSAQEQEIIEEQ